MTKRNRRLAGVSAAAFAVLIATGCEQGLTEANENPNAPESVPIQNLLLGGIWDVAANSSNQGVFGQWTQLYHAENWAQHVAQPVYNEEDTYTPRAAAVSDIWTVMFYALTDLKAVKTLALGDPDNPADDDDNAWAVAEIMTVYGQMMLTDYYGDMPYSEALKLDEGITAPVYDAQSSIYPDLIARLVAAAGRIDTGALVTFAEYDRVYGGDMDGWLAFANSLQLRLAMRMSNANATAAEAAFTTAWASTIISSNDEQADIEWDAAQPAANPVYEGIVLAGRFGDFRMSESLIDRLADFADPRLPIYAQPATADGAYRGLRNGLEPQDYDPLPTTTAGHFSQIGEYFMTADTPSNLLSYAEVLFLGAEAAELGWIADDAETLYEEAITAAMEDVGVDAADIATYLANPDVDYNSGTYVGLDAIRVQKWIALFLAGPEAYSDLRRIDWSFTTNPTTVTNGGADLVPAENSDLPSATDWPERLTYPPEEQLYNGDNVPDPAPGLTDPVWWAN